MATSWHLVLDTIWLTDRSIERSIDWLIDSLVRIDIWLPNYEFITSVFCHQCAILKFVWSPSRSLKNLVYAITECAAGFVEELIYRLCNCESDVLKCIGRYRSRFVFFHNVSTHLIVRSSQCSVYASYSLLLLLQLLRLRLWVEAFTDKKKVDTIVTLPATSFD